MSAKTLIESFEAEREEIRGKLEELQKRQEFLEKALMELRRAAPGGAKRGAAAKEPKAPKTRGPRKGRGGMTVKDAILKVVGDAKEALSPAEIIPATVKLSGGKEPSIRTQLNNLSRSGELEQVPHAGRGFKYTLAGGAAPATKSEPAAPKASKGGGKKKRAAKKGPAKKRSRQKSAAPAETVVAEPTAPVEPPVDTPPEA